MRHFVLAVSLCLSACVHASPLRSAAGMLSTTIATAIGAPSEAESAEKAEKLAHALTPAPGKKIDAKEVFDEAIPAGKDLLKESAAAAPLVAEQFATAPGPLGVVKAVVEFFRQVPMALFVVLFALVGLLGFLAKTFHWIKPKVAAKWASFVEAVLVPIFNLTPTKVDNFVAQRVLDQLHLIAAEDPGAAELLATAHAEAGVPMPKPAVAPANGYARLQLLFAMLGIAIAAGLLWSSPAQAQLVTLSPNKTVTADISASVTCSATSGVKVQTEGMGTVGLEISGTFTATLAFKYSMDGATFNSMPSTDAAQSVNGSNSANSATAAGRWTIPVAGYRAICIDTSSFTSGTATIVMTTTGAPPHSILARGYVAEGTARGGNPVPIAGKGFNAQTWEFRPCDKVLQVNASGGTTVEIIAAVASQKIYVCGYQLLWSVATAAAQASFVEGTGTNCATGQTTVLATISAPTAAPTNPNVTLGPVQPSVPFTLTAGDALCVKVAGANNLTVTGWLSYTQN